MTNLSALTLAQLAAAYNAVSATPVKKFSDKAAAVKRVEKLLTDANVTVEFGVDGNVVVSPVVETAPAAPVKGPSERTVAKAKLLASVYAVIVDHNPKKADAAVRFEHYRSLPANSTVQAYVDFMATLGHSEARTLADVKWDLAKGWIVVA